MNNEIYIKFLEIPRKIYMQISRLTARQVNQVR